MTSQRPKPDIGNPIVFDYNLKYGLYLCESTLIDIKNQLGNEVRRGKTRFTRQ